MSRFRLFIKGTEQQARQQLEVRGINNYEKLKELNGRETIVNVKAPREAILSWFTVDVDGPPYVVGSLLFYYLLD